MQMWSYFGRGLPSFGIRLLLWIRAMLVPDVHSVFRALDEG